MRQAYCGAAALAAFGLLGGTSTLTVHDNVTAALERARPAAPINRRPNIVVIMADDMRADDMRWMPMARRLVGRGGATFTNSFVSLPLCCPSRTTFLTGEYAHHTHVLGNDRPFGFQAFDDSSTIATDLSRVGYHTALVGKYLNGYGFMPRFGQPAGTTSVTYVPPGWTRWAAAPTIPTGPLAGSSVYNYRNTTLNRDGHIVSLRGQYNTQAFGSESVKLIRQLSADRHPFFLDEAYVAPHFGGPGEADDPRVVQYKSPHITIRTPAVTSAVRGRFDSVITSPRGRPEQDVSDKPAWIGQLPMPDERAVHAMVESDRQRAEALTVLDQQVRRTFDALRTAGVLRNTYVIFTSDNGWSDGEHRFEADKTEPYQPDIRVPLLVRGPGIPAGSVRRAAVSNVDLAPTIDRIAGASADRVVDGRSILRVAREGGGTRQPVLIELGPFETLERWTRDALTLSASPTPHHSRFVVGVQTPRWSYFEWATSETELYDLRHDPHQLHNLSGEPKDAATEAQLRGLLSALRDCTGGQCRQPG